MGLFFDDAPSLIGAEPWRVDIMQAVLDAGCQGIHNFSLGSLLGYFRLGSLREDQVQWQHKTLILSGLPGTFRRKVFMFGDWHTPLRIAALQRESVVYSQAQLQAPKRTKFKETAYRLAQVFDPVSYTTARKRHRRLTAPPGRLVANGITVRRAVLSDLPGILALHDAWVAYKLADPATMRTMFPRVRYRLCMQMALLHEAYGFRAYVATDADGLILSARCLYVEGSIAYDLAFFSRHWQAYSNMVEDVATVIMAELHLHGVEVLNCGASLNKNLSAYKSHWPSTTLVSYAYGRLKG